MWVDLERYYHLNEKLPIVFKFGSFYKAVRKGCRRRTRGCSKVAAAQRTVSSIRELKQMFQSGWNRRKCFQNSFGGLPSTSYDDDLISGLVPNSVSSELAQQTPAIQADYATYKAAEATLVSIKAKDNFKVGFETRLTNHLWQWL